MGDPKGFMKFDRRLEKQERVEDRIKHNKEITLPLTNFEYGQQASRCMSCGVPTCHAGCPTGDLIPTWMELVEVNRWKDAYKILNSTNNFPEFTGRLCHAPCEEACVLGINENPVSIQMLEKQVVERAFSEGWVVPDPPLIRTGKSVAVIGSGPSGLSVAQQLNRAGHNVTVFERADRIGGLLRYGIPNHRLEKWVLDRRLQIMEKEGITFFVNANVGENIDIKKLEKYHATCVCVGSTVARDLPIPGRDLEGIHFLLDYLSQQNKIDMGDDLNKMGIEHISAKNKNVIIISGHPHGWLGVAHRQGCKSLTNFDLLPEPSMGRPCHQPWPFWPERLRTSSDTDEGIDLQFSIILKQFIGRKGKVTKVQTVNIIFEQSYSGRPPYMKEVEGSEKEWAADMVILGLGYMGPETHGILQKLSLELSPRTNVETDSKYMTSSEGVFAAGDARRGQSQIVWAISDGRQVANSIDTYLMGKSLLPVKMEGDLPIIK